MTVKQLTEALKIFNPEAPVIVQGQEYGYDDPGTVHIVPVCIDPGRLEDDVSYIDARSEKAKLERLNVIDAVYIGVAD